MKNLLQKFDFVKTCVCECALNFRKTHTCVPCACGPKIVVCGVRACEPKIRRNSQFDHTYIVHTYSLAIQETNFNNFIFSEDIHSFARQTCQVAGESGTCMFVWECLKTEGKHLGMCMDGFMFGSCCVHDDDDNKVIQSNEDTGG